MFYFYEVSHIQSILCMHTKLTLMFRNYFNKIHTYIHLHKKKLNI